MIGACLSVSWRGAGYRRHARVDAADGNPWTVREALLSQLLGEALAAIALGTGEFFGQVAWLCGEAGNPAGECLRAVAFDVGHLVLLVVGKPAAVVAGLM